MLEFTKEYEYKGSMDYGVVALCNAMNALPGIKTFESCCGHGQNPFEIWFRILRIEHNAGLFFLTRCIDRRYWKYGNEWSITLSVSDKMEDNILPTSFKLASTAKGEEAYSQAYDLVRNMEYHLNHKCFIKGYHIDLSQFNL